MYLHTNQLSSPIPPELGKLTLLQDLEMSTNHLTDQIPSSLSGLTSLRILHLHINQLFGPIPPELKKLTSLQDLELAPNNLTGQILASFGNLSHLKLFGLSQNELSGSIPSELGKLKKLRITNFLEVYLKNWDRLENLDLSRNGLTGQIPGNLVNSEQLNYLNLSFNYLSHRIPHRLVGGSVPSGRAFQNVFIEQLQGTKGLCGNIAGLQPCKSPSGVKNKKMWNEHRLILTITTPILCALLLFAFIGIVVLYKYRKKNPMKADDDLLTVPNGKLTYKDVLEATNGFDPTFGIGVGGCGKVYKAQLSSKKIIEGKTLHSLSKMVIVAVKRHHLSSKIANFEAFLSKIRTLTEIRH
ncbi:MDIS1-interacting receptor like kinase 2-like [Olea europaea subsp. europaea]|uniref:MDIS1-interacting receptor like kinase 2-like n=1 Tax=Olea europaea subsp. europaea TaxID=158383 RepID=A0A8S0SPR0_OLEEU|nr:MDIS1-interacting receptor like kinase 2-like [Olea europaea subsp. europaea]